MEKYYTYILKSKGGRYYIGQTKSIEERLERHNKGRERSTRAYSPRELRFVKEFSTRSEAVQLERKLKSFKNKWYLTLWIEENEGFNLKSKYGM